MRCIGLVVSFAAASLLLVGCHGEPAVPEVATPIAAVHGGTEAVSTADAATDGRAAHALDSPAATGLLPVAPPADTPDRLVANLLSAWKQMDADGVREVLAPGFHLELQPGTSAGFPDAGASLEARVFLRSHAHLFAGQTGVDASGVPVPGVRSLAIEACSRLGAWMPTGPGSPFPSALAAPYEVRLRLSRDAGQDALAVEGTIQFFAALRDSLRPGELRRTYRLAGLRDLTDEGGPEPDDRLGVYLDPDGLADCGDRTPSLPFAAYLLLRQPQAPVDGYECTVTWSGAAHEILSTSLPPGSLDVDPAADVYRVGSATPFPTRDDGSQLLCSWNLLVTGPGPLSCFLGPVSPPSLPGGRPVLASGAELRLGLIASGSAALPVAVVNGACPPHDVVVSLGALMCTFR